MGARRTDVHRLVTSARRCCRPSPGNLSVYDDVGHAIAAKAVSAVNAARFFFDSSIFLCSCMIS